MPQSVAMWSRMRFALLGAALVLAPTQLSAQGRTGESVIVTAASVRVRTAPSISSLSIDDFAQGSVFPLAGEDYQTADWLAVIVDGRIAYLPRFAAALRQRGQPSTPTGPAAAPHTVIQAGAPAAAPAAPMIAARPRAAERRVEPAPAPAPVQQAPPRPAQPVREVAATSPAPAPVVKERAEEVAVVSAPPAQMPAPMPAAREERAERPETPAAEQKPDAPVFKPRRMGLNLTAGVLGSATVIETVGIPKAVHVTGTSFIGIRYGMLGLYAAPEMGQGGGFRSSTLDGGAALHLINLHPLRITALGGYLRHSETTVPEDSTVAPVTRSLQGYTVGGMASIPFFGPLRLAYRGQYDTVRDAGIPIHRVKHSVGIVY